MFQVTKVFNLIRFPYFRSMASATALMAVSAWAQPPVPTTPDIMPSATPTGAALNETVDAEPDAEGFKSIFDATGKGWWHSAQTGHSGGNPNGGVFKITTVNNEPVLYTNDRAGGIGGILMTKKKYAHYEMIFDFWPDFGNDGGIFNRTEPGGKAFQTVLDYIEGASVGGTWGEGGFTGRDIRPWKYTNENTISLLAGNSGWTYITSKNNPTSYGCAASGCVEADYFRLWDREGWNQMRIKFYGGSQSGEGAIRMFSWFRKVGSTVWVPIIADTTLNTVWPPNFIGIQVHGGNRYYGEKGSWFKNIKLRELKANGEPLNPVAVKPEAKDVKFSHQVIANGDFLTGGVDKDYTIAVHDIKGNLRETYSGRAGRFTHAFKPTTTGLLMVQVKTSSGIESTRVLRARE